MNLFVLLIVILSLAVNEAKAKERESSNSSKHSKPGHVFEIFLPYHLDFVLEMHLTSIFPRRFHSCLKAAVTADKTSAPIITIPNFSGGALLLGTVHVENANEMKKLLRLMENMAQRVFRTGLNEDTVSGNFRLPARGLNLDPQTHLLHLMLATDYPTDSYNRFNNFLKNAYFRLSQLVELEYEPAMELRSDSIVIGKANVISAIDLTAFRDKFGPGESFIMGFAVFDKILVKPEGLESDSMKSMFHFDYPSNEPIIGIENVVEETEQRSN